VAAKSQLDLQKLPWRLSVSVCVEKQGGARRAAHWSHLGWLPQCSLIAEDFMATLDQFKGAACSIQHLRSRTQNAPGADVKWMPVPDPLCVACEM
jgi:hypothetical protein